MKLKSRKPKFAVVALGDNVDVGSFFNLLMSNGYPNVTFLTNIIDHVEVKKYISEIQELEKSSSTAEAMESALDKRSTSPEPISMPSATATVNVIPSTSVFIPPLETEIRSTSNMKLNPDASYINCKLCDNKIMVSRLSNLTNHVRRHSSVKQYSCIYCPYQHNEMSKVRTHMASQHGDSLTTPNDNLTPELQKIWCAYMEKCFPGYLDSQGKSGRSALEVFGGRTLAKLDGAPSSSTMEEEEAVNLADKLHNCCECGDAISGEDDSKEPFTNHIREKHADVCSPYKCGECGFLAAYEYIVRGHIVSEHAMIAADVAVTIQPDCDDFSLFIGKFFPSLDDGVPDISEELKAFVDTAQSQVEENNYANEENAHFSEAVSAEMLLGCDSNTENEDISMEREQTTCTICSLSFNLDDIESLMYHAKKHYFIKQFECPECEFAAEEYDEVENHLGACHAGEGAVVDLNGEMLQQAWMQTMKKCFSELVDRNGDKNNITQKQQTRKRQHS